MLRTVVCSLKDAYPGDARHHVPAARAPHHRDEGRRDLGDRLVRGAAEAKRVVRRVPQRVHQRKRTVRLRWCVLGLFYGCLGAV